MPVRKTLVITRREYLSRIKTKGFWIGTVALPLLMAAFMVVPSLMIATSKGSLRLAVVDETRELAAPLREALTERLGKVAGPKVEIDAELLAPAADRDAQRQLLDRRVLDGELDAWLWISPEGLAMDRLLYHARTTSNLLTLEVLEGTLSRVVQQARLRGAGYDVEEIGQLTREVSLQTIRVTEAGGEADAGLGDVALAVALFFILYMIIMIYGSIVLQGVMEEKSNRVIEVVVSSAHPTELMAGKLLGIAGVSLTQLGIWLGSAALLTAPGLVAAVTALPEGVLLPRLSFALVGHVLALFILGFTLYGSFYALIGAAFNNPQEAQQMAGSAVFFLVLPVMILMPVINDPDSTLAVVTSLVPLFTPLIMLLRIVIKTPPLWQLLLAYGLTLASAAVMVWVCARVYRVGILMYGKRPSLREIWRWARYAP
jgi:ABC-2 type transport system permease protein